jgi:hypothetical protein
VLTVEEVALREMRDRGRGWVWGQWYVFLAGGLGGKSSWVKKIAGGEESEQVRVVEARAPREPAHGGDGQAKVLLLRY